MFACCRHNVAYDPNFERFDESPDPVSGNKLFIGKNDDAIKSFGDLRLEVAPSMDGNPGTVTIPLGDNSPLAYDGESPYGISPVDSGTPPSMEELQTYLKRASIAKEQIEDAAAPAMATSRQVPLSKKNEVGSVRNPDAGSEGLKDTPTKCPPQTRPYMVPTVLIPPPKPAPPPAALSPGSVAHAQKKIMESARQKSPRPLRPSPKKGWQPAAYSADVAGLRTRDRDKMVDQVDETFKRRFIVCANFVREGSGKDPRDMQDVPERERATILFLLLQCAVLENQGKQNIPATVVSLLSAHAEGEKALAGPKIKDAAKRLQFMCTAYYKPLIEAITSGRQTRDRAAAIMEELNQTSRVRFGEKPPGSLPDRIVCAQAILERWNYETIKQWISKDEKAFQKALSDLIDVFDKCRKGGRDYLGVVEQIVQKHVALP